MLQRLEEDTPPPASAGTAPHMAMTPPSFDGQLTANSAPERVEPTGDPLSLPAVDVPLLGQDKAGQNPDTIEEIEESVDSPHLEVEKEEKIEHWQTSCRPSCG